MLPAIVMGIRKFKEHFYKYIDKKDFALAVSVVFSMFVSTALTSIYDYLDDKEKMYLRRAEHPPKRINVKFISFAEYEYMTNPDNWKPSILRNADEEMVNEYHSKMSAVITSLMNQKSIQKLTKSDKLAIAKSLIAGKFKRENPDVDTTNLKEEEMVNIMSDRWKSKTVGKKKKKKKEQKTVAQGNLPTMVGVQTNKAKAGDEYFVVSNGDGGQQRNPDEERLDEKNPLRDADRPVTLAEARYYANKHADDGEGFFQRIKNVLYAIVGKKKKDPRMMVVDSRYDRYGNRIDRSTITAGRRVENNTQSASLVAAATASNANNTTPQAAQEAAKTITVNPVLQYLKLDGELDDMNGAARNLAMAEDAQSYETIIMISKIELNLEQCWNRYIKKYKDSGIKLTYLLTFNPKRYPESAKVIQKVVPQTTSDSVLREMERDVLSVLNSCKFSDINEMKQSNYKYWKEVQVTFEEAKN